MARKRKKDALSRATAEQMKMYSSLQEQAELARKAAEAMPTAEEMKAIQEAQKVLETQEAQQAQLYAEIQQYLHRPLSEIEKLPDEKRNLVWEELARRLVESPGFEETMTAVVEASKKAIEAAQMWTESLPQIKKKLAAALEPAATVYADIRQSIAEALTGDRLRALQTFATLAPYISAEADAHPEKYGENATEPGTANELIAAAARRARADGKEIPPLKVEEGEQMQMQLDFPLTPEQKEADRIRHIEEARQRREQAQSEGVFDTTSSNLATIAEKDLGFSYFTSAVIKNLPGGVEMKDLMLDDEGKINLYDLTGGEKPIQEVLNEVDKIHTGFLMWALGLAYNNSDLRETNSNNAIIPVNVPAVLNGMHIDPRPRLRQLNSETNKKELVDRRGGGDMADLRRDKFMEFMRPFLNMAAFFGDDLYQIVGFYSYNKASETAYISIPYLFKLVEYSKLHATRHGAIVNIFHADIMTENQTAVELANRIAMGVLLRGLRPDAKTYKNEKQAKAKKTVQKQMKDKDGNPITVIVDAPPRITTWTPKFSSLINDCPQLAKELDAIRTSTGAAETAIIEAAKKAGKEPDAKAIAEARKADHKTDARDINNKLRDVFGAAIRIIMEKSDMPEYYADFRIRTGNYDTFKAPTKSTLNEKLTITHKGKNPHYHGQ